MALSCKLTDTTDEIHGRSCLYWQNYHLMSSKRLKTPLTGLHHPGPCKAGADAVATVQHFSIWRGFWFSNMHWLRITEQLPLHTFSPDPPDPATSPQPLAHLLVEWVEGGSELGIKLHFIKGLTAKAAKPVESELFTQLNFTWISPLTVDIVTKQL